MNKWLVGGFICLILIIFYYSYVLFVKNNTTTCTGNTPYNNNGTCVSSCTNGKLLSGTNCVDNCTSVLPYNDNGTCVSSCPITKYNNVSNICVNKINFPVTNTIPATVVISYNSYLWNNNWGIPSGVTNPFNSSDTWIYTSSKDYTGTSTDNSQHSFQINYNNTSTSIINATLNAMADSAIISISINNTNIPFVTNSKLVIVQITLLPGINLIDINAINSDGTFGGLVFNIKDNLGNVLLRSSANVMIS